MMRWLLPVYTMLLREFILFYRQKGRLVGVLMQPLVFWLVLGTGLNSMMTSLPGQSSSYLEYFFPGILLMVIMFTAIFSTMSIIEDRKQGFLRSIIVAPVPRPAITLGKILGGSTLALAQGGLFLLLLLTPLLPIHLPAQEFIPLMIYMFLMGFSLTGVGTIMAWTMDSIQGYHAVMSVFLFPLWIFSGAVFPVAGTPAWMGWLMTVNPLTHGLALMRGCLLPPGTGGLAADPLTLCRQLYVLAACIGIFLVANRVVAKKS